MTGAIDTMRSEGHEVLSTCPILREQGCQIGARTYRAWRSRLVAARTVTDAQVLDAIRDTTSADVSSTPQAEGRRTPGPKGLSERRKMTMLIRRTTIRGALRGSIDWAPRTSGVVGNPPGQRNPHQHPRQGRYSCWESIEP